MTYVTFELCDILPPCYERATYRTVLSVAYGYLTTLLRLPAVELLELADLHP